MDEAPPSDKSAKFCRRWQKHRRHGVVRFVVVWGLLAWGMTMLLMMDIIMPYILSQEVTFPSFTNIVIYGFAGLLWGFFMWHMMESRFAKEANTCNFRSEDAKPDA